MGRWGWGLVNMYSVGMISEGRARDKVWRRAQQLPPNSLQCSRGQTVDTKSQMWLPWTLAFGAMA